MIAAKNIAQVVQGSVIQEGLSQVVDNLIVDSRKITHPLTSIFIPLITERRNAHHFIPEVYQQQVRVFLISEEINITHYPAAWFIKVTDTLSALQKLVTHHRKQFTLPVIAITGSNGKTIIKEWLCQLLEPNYHIIRSPKSYNSQIGVPLSVWEIKAENTLAIFEAGISQINEMEKLEKIIRPTIGIFSNIGDTHNEGFLNIRQKINEKLKLFYDVETLFYCKDYLELHECIVHFTHQTKKQNEKPIKLISWSKNAEADLQIIHLEKENFTTTITALYKQQEIQIEIPFIDNAYIENSIHCWLVLLEFSIPHATIAERMKLLTPVAMRLELKKAIGNCTLINDSYNSDISSFSIALDFLEQQKQYEKKTVILSDILQSGREIELYDEVSDLLKQKKINQFIGIGETILRNKKVFRESSRMNSTFYKTTAEFLAQMDVSKFNNEIILLKGARKFEFEKIAKRLEERVHQTVLEINLNALVHNLHIYQAKLQKKTKIMAMVKAFSYGSGSYEIANKLQFLGVDYLAVAYADEGVTLRKGGIKLPIMVMNPEENAFDTMLEWNLEPEIYSIRVLQKLITLLDRVDTTDFKIHLKIDTGMHRLGFELQHIDALINILKNTRRIKIQSVFTHLAASEDLTQDNFTTTQANQFNEVCTLLEKHISYPFLKHVCNTSGIIRHPQYHYDMVRIGIGLYGIDATHILEHQLKNVSTLKTIVSQIKHLSQHETVGYNRKGIVNRTTTTATVCIGYADGISRQLGNGNGKMYIHGKLAPIIGNVCMDMCMVDITDISNVKEGDEVIVFGEPLSVNQVAAWANTIPYEIFTSISQRVKRVYFEE